LEEHSKGDAKVFLGKGAIRMRGESETGYRGGVEDGILEKDLRTGNLGRAGGGIERNGKKGGKGGRVEKKGPIRQASQEKKSEAERDPTNELEGPTEGGGGPSPHKGPREQETKKKRNGREGG